MLLKFGMIVTDGRNKLGGHVLSKNRGGNYARTKVTPVNPQTTYQAAVRQAFTSFSQGWRGLTSDQRLAWNGAVTNFQRTNVFGDLKSPSGFNLYQRLNNVLQSIDQSPLLLPPLPSSVGDLFATMVRCTIGSPSLSLVLNSAGDENTSLKIFATPPLSPGKSFVKNQYRFISFNNSPVTSPQNILDAYIAKFGSLGVIGQQIWIKTQAVNQLTGQVGTPAEVSVIATV
jgi:hypothetical protein